MPNTSRTRYKKLDVRPILAQGHEPCSAILKHVDALKEKEGLLLIAPFLPSPLIEKLGSEGFRSRIERGSTGEWLVFFSRETKPDSS